MTLSDSQCPCRFPKFYHLTLEMYCFHLTLIWLGSLGARFAPDCSKLVIKWKNDKDVTICWHDIVVKYFQYCLVSLVKFSYWFKFHVNIINGSGVLTIFFYKGLTRNWDVGNTPSEFSPISGDWGELGMCSVIIILNLFFTV